ncbi:MAG: FtsQ-type POTRA domain-containing protein [Deltaproteobacteria bacterium]|nr:FtsQ-type POTRA domain-containing protein [Deltaproteobacteria bacterium]
MLKTNKRQSSEVIERKREIRRKQNRKFPRPASRRKSVFSLEALRARFARDADRLHRIGGALARIALLAVLVAGAVAGGRLIERHVRTSKSFATKVIKLEGASRLGRDEVLRQAGLAKGKNIFEVSAESARRNLLKHPWIATASVVRRLPGSYRVSISERRAVALLSIGDLYLVADDGTVFKPLAEGDPFDLPIITGVDSDEFASDRDFRASLIADLVGLLEDYARAGLMRRERLAEIHLEPGRNVALYVGSDSTEIRLGKPPFLGKLHRLKKVLESLEKKKSRAFYVYLDNVRRPDRVTVRLR